MLRFLLIVILCMPLSAFAQESRLKIKNQELQDLDLSRFTDYFCTFDQITLATAKTAYTRAAKPIHFNYRVDEECWMRFQIENQSQEKLVYLLEHQQALTTSLSLYFNDTVETIGYEHSFYDRKVQFANPSFQIELNPGLNEIFIKQRSKDQMWLHFILRSP